MKIDRQCGRAYNDLAIASTDVAMSTTSPDRTYVAFALIATNGQLMQASWSRHSLLGYIAENTSSYSAIEELWAKRRIMI